MRQEFTKRTKLEAFQRANGRCEKCTARLMPGCIEYHHAVECTMDGTAEESNCVCLCKTCHLAITKQRSAVLAKSNRQRAKHLGIKRPSSFATNRDGKFIKRMNGTVERR